MIYCIARKGDTDGRLKAGIQLSSISRSWIFLDQYEGPPSATLLMIKQDMAEYRRIFSMLSAMEFAAGNTEPSWVLFGADAAVRFAISQLSGVQIFDNFNTVNVSPQSAQIILENIHVFSRTWEDELAYLSRCGKLDLS